MLRIYLLGPLRLFDQETPRSFSALPKTLPLWAYLLLNPEPIARDRLANLLWPERSQAEARANLRRHLHDLRQALPPATPDAPWVLTEQGTIQWNPAAPAWFDVAAFVAAAADPNRLDEAVDLYGGDLLPNLYDDWIFAHRERLRLCLFDALAGLMQQARARNDYPRAIALAQQILHHDPLREDVVRELMGLRHQSGDRAGALHEYRRFADRLRDELDVAPMLETSALYEAIARQTLALAARGERQTPPPASHPTTAGPPMPPQAEHLPPNNLPAQLTTFIGRDEELAAVQQMLLSSTGGVRLLTLTGPGGSGKTRLALEAATRLCRINPPAFPDGVFVVWLATVENPELLLSTIANTLSVSVSVGKTPLDALQDYFRTRRLLLVLDNMEHLTAAALDLVPLLGAAPGLRIVATSRALLRVYGEHEFIVPPLSLPDTHDPLPPAIAARYASIALFVARSRAANPNFALTEQNVAAVAAICARLDGLPLAIELAAARSKLLSPQAILARLDNALAFLSGRGGAQPGQPVERHQTLRATLDWSFQLLEPRERALLARLAVFSGSFTLEQAETICDLEAVGDVLNGLEALVNNSLLRQFEFDNDIYFRMLATIHEYAATQLQHTPEAETLRKRHAVAFLAFAQAGAIALQSHEQNAWLHQLEGAHANLCAALSWAIDRERADVALPLATALHYFWIKGGRLAEGRQWMARVLAMPASQPATALRGAALYAAAALELAYTDVDYTLARAHLHESIDISRAVGEQITLHRAQMSLAYTHLTDDPAQARQWLEESLRVFRTAGDRWGEANALAYLAHGAGRHGDLGEMQRLLANSAAIFQSLGDQWSLAYTVAIQAIICHLDLHEYELARQLYCQALPVAEAAADRDIIGIILANLADLAVVEQAYDTAEPYARRALALFHELGELWQPPRLQRLLGAIAATRGDYAQAVAQIHESIRLNRKLGDQRAVIAGLIALAHNANLQRRHALAARMLAAAEIALATEGARLLPADRAIQKRALAAAKAGLPPAEWAAAWADGRATPLEEALMLV